MRHSTTILLSSLWLLTFAIPACGKKRTQATSQAAADDPSIGAVVDDSTRPQTLAITEGDLQGASLQVPAGALPEGSRISLQAGTQTAEFATAIGAPEAVGSAVVAVTMTAADGSPVVAGNAGAIALSIPVTGDDPAYALAPGARILANLVCLHQGPDQALGLWRYPAFSSFDRTTKLATIKITTGGLYQLAFLDPSAPIEGFEAAQEQVAPAPITLAGLTCPDGLTSFYERAKDHPTFVKYHDLYLECTCRRRELTVEQCSASVASAFGSSMCVASAELAAVDDARIHKIYAPALDALTEYCPPKS